MSSENEKKSPDYESKASEYLDTLEKEAEKSSTAEEGGAGGLNGRKYVLSFKEGGNAEDSFSSQLKGGGAVSGKEGDNRAAEKADDASDRGNAGDSRGTAGSEESGENGRGSGGGEGGEGGESSGAGSIRSREKVLFDDPSHITVVLDGTGWIFTGEKDGKNITFLSRTVDGGKTVFSFRAGSGKVFVLNFQFQNTDGSSRRTDIELASRESADSENNRDSLLPEDEGKGTEKDSDDVKNLPADSPDSASGKGAENNLSSMKSSAEKGTVEAELEESDINKLFEEALVLMENKEYGKASEKLEQIRKSPYQFPETDRLYFLLGQCSEKNEKNRDPVKAEMYYSMLLDQFPFSIYYDRAEKRKRYLLKYFINIK